MADSCCSGVVRSSATKDPRRRRILWIVLLINALMFGIEFSASLWADSSALMADSVDMLMDSLVYAVSLFALDRTARMRAGAALTNSGLEFALAGLVLAQVAYHALSGVQPAGLTMQIVAAVALGANLLCAGLLLRYRHVDINMRAVWLCTRNDVAGNAATIVAGLLVAWLGTAWPDLVIGVLLAALFIRTSWHVAREAIHELRRSSSHEVPVR